MGDGGTGHGGTGPGRSPAAGAVPAPDRRVLSVPGRGACGLRPHPPAAGGGPGQRCSLSTGCTGSPRRPRPSPQPGAACRGPRRPCAQVSDTGTLGGLSTYETTGGAVRIPTAAPSPAAPHCPVGCHSWLLRAHLLPSPPAVPRRSGRGSGLRQLSSTVSVPIGNVGARPGLMSQVWGIACFEGRSHLLRWRCCVRAHDNQAADFEAL